ncbi:MAG: TolC family protein [Eubacteriales bacterium]|nr:TolC family protein [Eubacteriales bacterium]
MERRGYNNRYRISGGRLTAAALAAGLCLLWTPAFAAETDTETKKSLQVGAASEEEAEYEAVDGGIISTEQLQDSVIEFQELGSLIHYNNVSVQNTASSVENQKAQYSDAKEYLKEEMASASRKKRNAKDKGEAEDYAEYASWQQSYSSAIESYENSLSKLEGYTSNKSRISQERQLTSAAQSLMISCQTLQLQQESAEAMAEVYRQRYENTKSMEQAGLATARELETAYDTWQSMEMSAESLKNTVESSKSSLCLTLGIANDGSVTFAAVPDTDAEKIDQINLEEDIKKAVNNNPDVISTRSEKSLSTAEDTVKSRTLEDLEGEAEQTIRELYSDLLGAKASVEAAGAGYESARLSWNNAQSKKNLGMLSNEEYLQAQAEYLQKKNSYESARLELTQAYQTYWWAVKGVL